MKTKQLMYNKNVKTVLMVILLISGFALINNESFAQSSAVSTGVPFLLIGPNARFSGMGETGTAIADDATAMHWNPSGLAFQNKGTEVNFTHSPWLAGLGIGDLFYDYLAAKKYVKSLNGTVGASLTYLNIGEVIYTDETGQTNDAKNYKAYEFAFALAYATKVSQSLGVGLTTRFIYSRLSPNDLSVGNERGNGTAFTTSFDLSMLWRPVTGPKFLKDKFSFGLNLSNLGPKISYVDAAQADPLPTQLRFGVAYDLVKTQFNKLTVSADFAKLLVNRYTDDANQPQSDPFYKAIFTSFKGGISGIAKTIQTSVGAEYVYNNLIALRGGYFYEDPSNGNRKFITLGAGIKYNIYGFDFSYINTIEENHPLANTLRFGLNVNF
ncbi:type IX secretion system outer membrane channel protein PorV [soil metagenome]